MPESDTLLAYLVPKITSRVEDAATDALAFVLNKSEACQRAFNEMLGPECFNSDSVVRFTTQHGYDGGKSRPDMVGRDCSGAARLLVESKFWAGLQPAQASRYLNEIDPLAPGVLLFICPERRIEYLWPQVCRQLEEGHEGVELEHVDAIGSTRRAVVRDRDVIVVLFSWRLLLDCLGDAAEDSDVKSDVDQLKGLARRENEKGFLPLTPDASAADFKAQDDHFRALIVEVVRRGRKKNLVCTKGLTWGRTKGYHRRYVSRCDADGVWFGIGVEYQQERYDQTPIWVTFRPRFWHGLADPAEMIRDQGWCWLPIRLKAGVVFDDMVDDAVDQIERICSKMVAG